MAAIRLLFLLSCFKLAAFTEPPCVIELGCAECIPEHMPLVSGARVAEGAAVVASGEELALSCGAGRLRALPLLAAVTARCEAGRFRTPDRQLRTLLELGCQESLFEDVLHAVEYCPPPLQGRVYRLQQSAHLAALCFDLDRWAVRFAHMSSAAGNLLRLPPHAEQRAPLTLLGNFNHMFDTNTRHAADMLFSDEARMNKRLRELVKHERITFAFQSLSSAKLFSSYYFDDQNIRASDFVSNRFAAWQSVAGGNLEHLHRDVGKFMKMRRPHGDVDVYAGTHGVFSFRAGSARTEIYLKPDQFPVPKYVWTVLHDKKSEKAIALVVLNDPFVAVSEIREAVFCESQCGRVRWLHELRRHRNYEAPLYGLTFCCAVHNFTNTVTEMPKQVIANVSQGSDGLLLDLLYS